MLFVTLKMYALDYTITFTGTGASTTVSSVIVQNLTQGTSVTIPVGNVLILVTSPNAVDQLSANNESIRIYPNPMQGKSTVSFYAKQAGNTLINVFGIDGRQMIGVNKNLQEGDNSFLISLPKGVYAIQVAGNNYCYAAKIISQSNFQNRPEISFTGYEKPVASTPQKSKSAVTAIPYTNGDRLLFKGTSGNYSTIVTDIPTQSKTLTFHFDACIDVDGNSYSVVQIGSQLWMAENLKTTHYVDGTNIQNITDNYEWYNLGQGYCWFNNDINNKNTYGALYSYWLIKYAYYYGGICPRGWHIPTDAEWTTLTNYLGGESITGSKLKETGTSHWQYPNSGATNESGFTGLSGGCRTLNGQFYDIGYYGYYWSDSQHLGFPDYTAWYRLLYYNYSHVHRSVAEETLGMSIRCIRDFINPNAVVPTLNTTAVNNITYNSAISGGNITSDGGDVVAGRGICWNTVGDPTIADNITSNGTGIGTFTSNLTNLYGNNTYYIRAYATNGVGTVYGNQITFSIPYGLATVETYEATKINSNSVVCGGSIINNGGVPITDIGLCYSNNPNPTISNNILSMGSGTGIFINTISNLTTSSTYYVRAFATNIFGTSYGNQITFATLGLASVSTYDFKNMTSNSVICGGYINSDGGATITECGVCYGTNHDPTIDNSKITMSKSTGDFSDKIIGLTPNTTYYFRAYAINSVGTAYGNEISFKTFTGSVTDIEGNVYNTIAIGNQIWMVENLKTTKYNDGTSIPNVTDNALWGVLNTPCYCWYNNDVTNKSIYGTLYNWYAVNTGKLAPKGWHVPSNTEWTTLFTFLGGESVAGSKLKETGTMHWESPNNATNETSFTALPGGYRSPGNGYFNSIGSCGGWWNSTEYDSNNAGSQAIISNTLSTYFPDNKKYGYSVRCIKNGAPAVTSAAVTGKTTISAICGGDISDDGGATVTERGICYSTSQNPTIIDNNRITMGVGIGAFSDTMIGLTPNTTYYLRAYAINSLGIGYGNEISFITYTGTVTDIDGNIYNTVTIGTQVWMAENLKTTKLCDRTNINLWDVFHFPYYAWYNDDIYYKDIYGALYNWYAVNTGKLAPTGWHVASDAEWSILTSYLGGASVAGGKLKETDYWEDPNTGATNEASFGALPGGYLNISNITFYDIGLSSNWWSSSEYTTNNAIYRKVESGENQIFRYQGSKSMLYSIRCIKD